VVAFAILRDTLSAQRRAKVLSMLNVLTFGLTELYFTPNCAHNKGRAFLR
jgi:hypothetical protein